jgi:dTDP-glucose 4,6-dehydratase/UDP-glucuronate decarboxylase
MVSDSMGDLSEPRNADDVTEGDLAMIAERAGAELEQLAGKRLLITGGAGFLGHHFVQAALYWNRSAPGRDPIEVTVYDNYARGVPGWLAELGRRDDLNILKHDVREPLPDDIEDFDYVVHAAGIASPTYYRRHPIETMDANIYGLRSLLEYAGRQSERGHPLDGFLFFSSSEIYGDPAPEAIPTPETYRGNVSCTGPRACYDESKRYGETLCVNFAREYGVPVSIARPFNNFGPGLKISDRRVIPDLMRDVLDGRDLELLSDGSATRTFCYATDAVTGYYKVLVRGRRGEPYNIGTEGPEITMRALADMIAGVARDVIGYQGKVIHGVPAEADYLVDNPSRRCPDLTKARDELGYNPAVTLREGLTRSLVWYTGNRVAASA